MIVVTGATGNVGRPLVQALAAAGEKVTAVARRLSAAEVPRGIQFRQADLAEAESLKPALDGARTLFLLLAGPLLVSGEDPRAVLDVITACGVRRVVLLSSQGARTRPEAISHSRLRAFEGAVRQAGLEWTILRPGGFYSNAFAWAGPVRSQQAVAAPFADVRLPWIDPADVAEVAAAALRDGSRAGLTYELTGPALISPRERAQAIGDALGTPISFTEQSRQEARAQMLQFMPEPVVEGTLDILGEPSAAELRVSPDAGQVLGRPPRTFAEWARHNIAAFR
jgi:uncharacterized protein YbjT (DUF2867 family)